MAKLRVTLACWNYDRTRALLEERVPIEGIELNYLNLPVEETFFRMLRHREFDVAELSLSSYTVSLFKEPAPFIAIPVFLRDSSAIPVSISTPAAASASLRISPGSASAIRSIR